MRNKLLLFLLFFTSLINAQEILSPLQYNPQILQKVNEPQFIFTQGIKHLYLYKETKQSLPFIDDFSSKQIKNYSTDTNSVLFSNTLVYYKYEVLGKYPDTLFYSTDTTYHFTQNKADSVPNPSFTIYIYDESTYPVVIKDSIANVFPAYTIVDQANPDTTFSKSTYLVNYLILAHFFNDDNTLWTGRGVFINNNHPINPPSIGVATFDALDENGDLYLGAGTIPKISDSLVSKGIDLSTLQPSDSLYLSFYVENKGYGEAPESKDTLVLQFLNSLGKWTNVWTSNTNALWPGDSFIQFRVNLNSVLFFHSNFKFRFYNYSSISGYTGDLGNRDHWHLDYVVLDKNRAYSDNYVSDVAFRYPPKTLINGYNNVPWEHFKSASGPMVPQSVAYINNISNTSASVNFAVQVKENNSILYSSASTQNTTINANSFHNFNESYGSFVYFSAQNDTAIFDVKYALNTSLAGNRINNDTAYYQQHFSNFYAYDDGSAEAGYGFYEAGAEFAYKFKILEGKGDTLRGVWVYFNEVIGHTNRITPFTFRIRATNNNSVGTQIWESSVVYPQIDDKPLSHYRYYAFPEAIFLKDSFYIGFYQSTSDYINIGFDLNSVATTKMYYKTLSGWVNSQMKGAVMLRPVFGKKADPYASVDEIHFASVSVYPNPASLSFYINASESFVLNIHDIQGKQVLSQNCVSGNNVINIESLNSGVYILNMINSNNEIQFQKLVVQ